MELVFKSKEVKRRRRKFITLGVFFRWNLREMRLSIFIRIGTAG